MAVEIERKMPEKVILFPSLAHIDFKEHEYER
jgi:hypothetical protein